MKPLCYTLLVALVSLLYSSCASKKKNKQTQEEYTTEQHQKNVRRSIDRKLLIPRDSLQKLNKK